MPATPLRTEDTRTARNEATAVCVRAPADLALLLSPVFTRTGP